MKTQRNSVQTAGLIAVMIAGTLGPAFQATTARACPFCQAISMTYGEEIEAATVAVFAKMIEGPKRDDADAPSEGLDITPPTCKFVVTDILKGKGLIAAGHKFDAVYFGDSPVGSEFLITGLEPPKILWGTPIVLNERAMKYIREGLKLPKDGPDRLAFFQEYLQDKDELLNRDAYDEFARTPYAGILEFKDRVKHDQLIEWIKNPEIVPSRRRLYFTLLSVCGAEKDVPMLEEMLKSTDRRQKGGLDALISCYLSLKGADGMPLIESLYLKDEKAEYVDTYAAIMALRFQGQEGTALKRERILEGFRHMLNRPKLADLVIPDLARWKDWSVIDRVVELFKKSDDTTDWIRVPVINYLRTCPDPKAKVYLEELKKIDPETVQRAIAFFPLGEAGESAKVNNAPVPDDAATSGRPPKKKGATDAKPDEGKNAEKSPPSAAKPADKNQTQTNQNDKGRVVISGVETAADKAMLRDDRPAILSPNSPWFYAFTLGLALALTAARRVVRRLMFVR